jgi:hypothetical protein
MGGGLNGNDLLSHKVSFGDIPTKILKLNKADLKI